METINPEEAAIAEALEAYYFKGIYEGDIDVLGGIFRKDALLFGDIKGQPYAKTLAEYLNGVAGRQSPEDSGKPFKGPLWR